MAAASKFKIAIDAGHGPDTPGKRCPDDSMHEYAFNSATARYAVELLQQYLNVEVLTTFEDCRDVPLQGRTDKANAWGANVFLSIHANASGNAWSDARGIETFVYTTRPAPAVALAGAVQRKLIAATGLVDRGIKSADFHVLRETHMTAILCECGFMSNKAEAALLKSEAYRRKCALAIVAGLVEAYGLAKKEQSPVTISDNAPKPEVPQWKIEVMQQAEEAGLIDPGKHQPEEPVDKAFVLAVALKQNQRLNELEQLAVNVQKAWADYNKGADA